MGKRVRIPVKKSIILIDYKEVKNNIVFSKKRYAIMSEGRHTPVRGTPTNSRVRVYRKVRRMNSRHPQSPYDVHVMTKKGYRKVPQHY